jgi:sugar lactone lactonase YvrE
MQKISLILPVVLLVVACTRNNHSPTPTPPISSDYVVSTYATMTSQNDFPIGVAVDPAGNVYACGGDTGTVWKIAPDSTISIVTAIGSTATDLVCDQQGNIYVLNFAQRNIAKITPTGIVSILAGGPNPTAEQSDGQGSAARFKVPNGLDIDSTGTLYVADFQSVRRVDQQGRVTTLYTDTNSSTQLLDVTIDSYHNQYYSNGSEIWRIDTLGNRQFVAGQPSINQIDELRMDNKGDLWIADEFVVRMVTPAGVLNTIAGKNIGGYADGAGNVAEFRSATGLAIDANGTIFVADASNKKIRKIVHK